MPKLLGSKEFSAVFLLLRICKKLSVPGPVSAFGRSLKNIEKFGK